MRTVITRDVYSSRYLGWRGWNNGAGEENWGFGAILGKKLTVSGLNMTQNALYHLNKI